MQPQDSIFRVPPFPAFPSVSRFVNVGSLADAFARVCRSIDAREGLSLVVGPPGTGKSLLCGLLAERFQNSHEVVLLGDTPIDSRTAFLRHLLHHLGVDFQRAADGDLQLALIDRVCAPKSASAGLLIMVDEAQSLSTEVLEAIRMATNIMRRGEPRVRAVVCGAPHLDETLAAASMEPFTQRVATRCYLHPLSLAETRQYINEAIKSCGAEPADTISPEAISAVHHACSGVPRLINQLMTQAIDCAEIAERTLIGVREIDLAWAQLQQLPSPMLEEPAWTTRNAVEFGELNEIRATSSPQPIVAPQPSVSPQQDHPFEDELLAEQIIDFSSLANLDARAEESCELACFTDATEAESLATEAEDLADIDADECGRGCGCLENECTRDAQAAERNLVATDRSVEWLAEPGDEGATRHEPPQSVIEIARRSPLPAALFGEFEEEEVIAVGTGSQPTAPVARAVAMSELESMLHEEIVGLSSEVHVFQFPGEEAPARFQHGVPIRHTEHALETHHFDEDMVLTGDDSDILIVEDDLDVRSRVEPPMMPREESDISVDFQSMLNRMRGGA